MSFQKSIHYIGGKIDVAFDKADELPVSIQIYDDIGKDPWTGEGFSAKDLANALKEIPNRNRELRIAVNSRGGDVNEGKTIRSMLEDWPGRIVNVIDGVAASTASWMIPADEVHARNHSQIFIHKSWAMVMGNSDDMTKAVAMLNTTDEQIADIYGANNKDLAMWKAGNTGAAVAEPKLDANYARQAYQSLVGRGYTHEQAIEGMNASGMAWGVQYITPPARGLSIMDQVLPAPTSPPPTR